MKKNKKNMVISLILLTVILITCIAGKDYLLQAYYTHKDKIINDFAIGKIEASVEEPDYIDRQVIKPQEEITKNPILSNTGEIQSYIRAQVYVPITKNLKYVDSYENIVEPSEEIEVVSYEQNSGWQIVSRRWIFWCSRR